MNKLIRKVLENPISKVFADRRKKALAKYENTEIGNDHVFGIGLNGFRISPFIQKLMTYTGKLECYGDCNEILSKIHSV